MRRSLVFVFVGLAAVASAQDRPECQNAYYTEVCGQQAVDTSDDLRNPRALEMGTSNNYAWAVIPVDGSGVPVSPPAAIVASQAYLSRASTVMSSTTMTGHCVWNPTGSGLILKLWDLSLQPNVSTSAGVALDVTAAVLRIDDLTGGTGLAGGAIKTDTTQAAIVPPLEAVSGPASISIVETVYEAQLSGANGTEHKWNLLAPMVFREDQGFCIRYGTAATSPQFVVSQATISAGAP